MTRRADVDWIRVTAFGILILYHVGLVYAPWDWHMHSAYTFDWLRYAALVTNPWRLTLLFLVSGVALRFMSRRLTPGAVLKARAERLLPPFMFGVVVLVPPQAWIEAMDKGSWHESLIAWWLMEFRPENLANGVPLNHLWFVLYIMVYSLLAAMLLLSPKAMAALQARLETLLTGPMLLIAPILYLAVARQTLFGPFGQTNHLTHDWYNHAMSFGVFLFGFILALSERIWTGFERVRWAALVTAALALPALITLEAHPAGGAGFGILKNTVFAIDQWATISTVLGFASRHIRHADGPVLRYLTDAVFPCYLAHQTILVIGVWLIQPLALPAAVEALSLVLITLGGSLAVYEIVRRLGPIRPLWGLKRHPARRAAPQPAKAA